MELVVTLVVLVELTKELVVMIDNIITTETNNTSTKANTTTSVTLTCYLCRDPRHLQRSCPLLVLWRSAIETLCRVQNTSQLKLDRIIDPMSLVEQIDIGILVTALASALPDRDGDIPMQ
ncbi:hypothetical protein N7530_006583 [Penicillium desertorum]|uniref:CCHC-type domain-containing protein n=1 Tax=Penicillium desertorum TaxID=1303715 RepID=A0A9X0BMR3_9EURO|nr:hypothetical protein N7530_006583 [Penicillium desertorum]